MLIGQLVALLSEFDPSMEVRVSAGSPNAPGRAKPPVLFLRAEGWVEISHSALVEGCTLRNQREGILPGTPRRPVPPLSKQEIARIQDQSAPQRFKRLVKPLRKGAVNPGSREARDAGCLCPRLDNCNGLSPPCGTDPDTGEERWIIVLGCPIHGPGPTGRTVPNTLSGQQTSEP